MHNDELEMNSLSRMLWCDDDLDYGYVPGVVAVLGVASGEVAEIISVSVAEFKMRIRLDVVVGSWMISTDVSDVGITIVVVTVVGQEM